MPPDLSNLCSDTYLIMIDLKNELVFLLALNDLIVLLMSVFDHIYQAVHNNCEIIDRNDNWSQLGFLEAFYIKNFSLQLMKALKPPEN